MSADGIVATAQVGPGHATIDRKAVGYDTVDHETVDEETVGTVTIDTETIGAPDRDRART